MGWIVGVLVALLVLGFLTLLVPTVFAPILGGLVPLLFAVALIGLGGVWWRHSRRRVDPAGKADQPGASTPEERP